MSKKNDTKQLLLAIYGTWDLLAKIKPKDIDAALNEISDEDEVVGHRIYALLKSVEVGAEVLSKKNSPEVN